MLSGDFHTFPISDLLQWFDQSRKTGVLEVEGPLGHSFWLAVADREIVRASTPLTFSPALQSLVPWQPSGGLTPLWPELCRDRIIDLFFHRDSASESPVVGENADRFNFAIDGSDFEGVPLSLSCQEITLDGLRRLDEWPSVNRQYPDEELGINVGVASGETPLQEALIEAGRFGLSLAEMRLSLGLSRPGLLYRLEPLRAQGVVRIAQGPTRPDPVQRLIRQTEVLLRERQLDEAAYVLEALLSTEIAEPRLVELWKEVEREQVAAFYAQYSPLSVPKLRTDRKRAARKLSLVEREVEERINGRTDVTALTLSLPRREIETLKALRKLVQLGVVELA